MKEKNFEDLLTETYKAKVLPYDISTGSISRMCSTVTVESSTSFKPFSSEQVAMKSSPTTSKLAQG
jgi:hypothetical protein